MCRLWILTCSSSLADCPLKAKTKKRVSFVLIGAFFLLTGIEYGKYNIEQIYSYCYGISLYYFFVCTQVTVGTNDITFLFAVVVLPTAWLYIMERFNGDPFILGLAIAAYCLSGLLSGPIMGW